MKLDKFLNFYRDNLFRWLNSEYTIASLSIQSTIINAVKEIRRVTSQPFKLTSFSSKTYVPSNNFKILSNFSYRTILTNDDRKAFLDVYKKLHWRSKIRAVSEDSEFIFISKRPLAGTCKGKMILGFISPDTQEGGFSYLGIADVHQFFYCYGITEKFFAQMGVSGSDLNQVLNDSLFQDMFSSAGIGGEKKNITSLGLPSKYSIIGDEEKAWNRLDFINFSTVHIPNPYIFVVYMFRMGELDTSEEEIKQSLENSRWFFMEIIESGYEKIREVMYKTCERVPSI